MTDNEQAALSWKYVPLQVAVIPFEDGTYGLFTAYDRHRTYRGALSGDDLLQFFRDDFAKRLKSHEREQQGRAALAEREAAVLDLEIDFPEIDFSL